MRQQLSRRDFVGFSIGAFVVASVPLARRQPVGVIGNSGRSTARHLHYEIQVDGKAYDPARFLEAGRYLVAVFDLGQSGGGSGGPN